MQVSHNHSFVKVIFVLPYITAFVLLYLKYAKTENPNVSFSRHIILSVSAAATNDIHVEMLLFLCHDNAFCHTSVTS